MVGTVGEQGHGLFRRVGGGGAMNVVDMVVRLFEPDLQ
jgi:hypothetical protein